MSKGLVSGLVELMSLWVEKLSVPSAAMNLEVPAAAQKCWYFLDELQDILGWELYARRLVDSSLVQLCLTGSSFRLLSSEIATELRGRSLETEVFPLSFPEFLSFNGIVGKIPSEPYSSRSAGVLRNAVARYLEEGGFPDVQDTVPRVRNKVLQEYVDAVVYRDVLERHEVPSVQALRYTLDYIIHNFARKISTRAISGVLKALDLSGKETRERETHALFEAKSETKVKDLTIVTWDSEADIQGIKVVPIWKWLLSEACSEVDGCLAHPV